MATLWRNFRLTLRGLRKSIAFSVAAVITLALGIGANTAMFTVIRAVMLKPLHFRDPDRLIYFSQENPARGVHDNQFPLPQFETLRREARSFDGLAAYGVNPESFSISGDGREPEALRGARVSGNFLEVLGVNPILGRGFLLEEDRRGGPCVALISAGLWKRRFAADPAIAGRTVTLDASACTIVGVLPVGFEFPFADVDVWEPRPAEWSGLPERFWNIPLLKGFARLKAGVTLEQAEAELQVLHAQYTSTHVGMTWEEGSTMRMVLLKDRLISDLRPMLWMLMGAVALVLLIACANVASLLLARGLARSHELAVQSALGAGRGRLIAQLLTESITLSIAGGALGMLLARWILAALNAVGNLGRTSALALSVPGSSHIQLDLIVLGFTFVLCVFTGIAFGLAPAWEVSHPDIANMLRDRAGSASRPGSTRLRSLLAIAQVALSVVLLIGAALLIDSIARLRAVNPGFQPAFLLTMKIPLPANRYDSNEKRWAFFSDLTRRVGALPGVRGASIAMSLPTTTNNINTNVDVEGQPKLDARRQPLAQFQSISPGYFAAMGIPIRRGREFTGADDRIGARPVVIINESFARRFWPAYPRGLNPVGQHIGEGYDKLQGAEIVGIASDVHEQALSADPAPEFYLPIAVHPAQTAYLAVRTNGDPIAWVRAIRAEISAIDPDQAISDVRTMETRFDRSLRQRRLTMELLSAFAAVALLLALIGTYGVTAYSVAQRTQEVGIRRALGAQHADILRLIVGHAMALTATGVVLGLAGAFALTRVLRQFLFQVSATDPFVFAGIAALFLLVALLACLIPARRAAGIDPLEALRTG